MKLFIFVVMIFSLSSCGKAKGESILDNQCGPRLIAGRDCIVCEKGGISCDWN